MKELCVYLSGVYTGRLIRKQNGNMQFRYEAEYGGPALSQALPLQSDAHPHAACLAVFGGLLPEGQAREVVARNAGVSAHNDFALLEEVGGDCAGAITLLPPGVEQNWFPVTYGIDEIDLDERIGRLPQLPLAAEPGRGIRLSLAGAQPKLPIILSPDGMALPMTPGAPTTHIIKPEPEAFPGLVDNEAFCLELADAVGFEVAAVSKDHTVSGRPYLLVERFDRDRSANPALRLHQEDFCQALGRASDRKYEADGGPSVRECFDLVRRATISPARDIVALWRMLVFNYLIGNCDAHGKNFSLLTTAKGPSLAPFYDLVSTTVYPALTRKLAMNIDGARTIDQVDSRAWKKLAEQLGLNERFALDAVEDVVAKTFSEAERLFDAGIHKGAMVEQVVEDVRRRTAR